MNNITRGGGVCSARRIPANQSTGGHGGHPLHLNNIFNKIKLLSTNISFLLCVSIIGFGLLHYGACGERHIFFFECGERDKFILESVVLNKHSCILSKCNAVYLS